MFGSIRAWVLSSASNGYGLTCGPQSTTNARQKARQPRTVQLARVRRATVGGDESTKATKAGKFKPVLNETARDAR